MRWMMRLAIGGAAALVALGVVWFGGGLARETQAQEVGTVVGWVYWRAPGYDYYPSGVEGQVPNGQPPERADVDEEGELPPPDSNGEGVQAPEGVQTSCRYNGCPTYYYWPVPIQGALVAVQGTSLSTVSDEDGWFMIEGVPLGLYQTVAATLPRGATLVGIDPDTQAASFAPFRRGALAVRANVVVRSDVKPVNLGVLFVGGGGYPQIYAPDQSDPQPIPEESTGGEPATP